MLDHCDYEARKLRWPMPFSRVYACSHRVAQGRGGSKCAGQS
jgi:hypothetical protein